MAHTITLTQDQLSAIINNAIANALNAQAPAQQPSVANTRGRKAKTQPKAEQPTQPAPQPKAEKQYTGKEPATAKQLWALFKCEKHAAKAAGKSFATWQEWKLANSKLTYTKAQKRFEKLGLPKPE
jgi:hypothetical protein